MQPIDLCALIKLTALDSHVAGRSVDLELPEHCMVRAEPEALRRVLTNLIENAHKYGSMAKGYDKKSKVFNVKLEKAAWRVQVQYLGSPGYGKSTKSLSFKV